MAEYNLDLIINPNVYGGYKNVTYLNQVVIPNLNTINKQNIILTKEQLKLLESKFCNGKSKSILADSLYNNVDIIGPLTIKNILSEKFILRILDILKAYKLKYAEYRFNFSWVYNLKKLQFPFNNAILDTLKDLGFNNVININEKINNTELELISLFTTCPNDYLAQIKNILDKDINYIPNNKIIKIYYDNYINNFLKQKKVFTLDQIKIIYDLFKVNNFKYTQNDLIYFMEFLKSVYAYMYAIYDYNIMYPSTNINSINNCIVNIITDFNNHNIYMTSDIFKSFINTNYFTLIGNYNFNSKYNRFLMVIKTILEVCLKNKNNIIEKSDYLSNISYNADTYTVSNDICCYKELIEYFNNNNLLEINNDLINKLILNKDLIGLEFLMNNNLITPNDEMMNYACYSEDIRIIKYLINNKFIPTIKNIYYIKNLSSNNANSLKILNELLTYGGLFVTWELIEYLISKSIRLSDLDKYGLKTPESIKKIEELSIKYRQFPYNIDFPSEYYNLISNITAKTNINDLENIINKFDTEIKMVSLLEHLINLDNFQLISYLKNKTNFKPNINVIIKSKNCEMYLDIFDLKI